MLRNTCAYIKILGGGMGSFYDKRLQFNNRELITTSSHPLITDTLCRETTSGHYVMHQKLI